MKIIKKITTAVLVSLPLAAGAVANVNELFDLAQGIMTRLVPLFIAAAVVVLLYGILKYILAGQEEEPRNKAKMLIIYGIIGLFVMVSIWGLVALLRGTFTLSDSMPPTIQNLLPF